MADKLKKQIDEAVYAGIYVRIHPWERKSKLLRLKYLHNPYFMMGRCIKIFADKGDKPASTREEALAKLRKLQIERNKQ